MPVRIVRKKDPGPGPVPKTRNLRASPAIITRGPHWPQHGGRSQMTVTAPGTAGLGAKLNPGPGPEPSHLHDH